VSEWLQIYRCLQLNSVLTSNSLCRGRTAGCDKQDALMRGGLYDRSIVPIVDRTPSSHRSDSIGRESRFLPTPPALDAPVIVDRWAVEHAAGLIDGDAHHSIAGNFRMQWLSHALLGSTCASRSAAHASSYL